MTVVMSTITRRRGHHYVAMLTGQITEPGWVYSPSLETHEENSAGTGPRCNRPIVPWEGKTMSWTSQGPGAVTCGHCARMREAQG